jgi:hypothetical protein
MKVKTMKLDEIEDDREFFLIASAHPLISNYKAFTLTSKWSSNTYRTPLVDSLAQASLPSLPKP